MHLRIICSSSSWHKSIAGVVSIALVILKRTMANTSLADCSSRSPIRLLSVPGIDDRTNDVIFCRHRSQDAATSRIVFFGGDTQDYPENMKSSRDNGKYVRWNLINTAGFLSNKFAKSDVFIVKPKRMHLKTFSCYDNFVKAQGIAPLHVNDYGAIRHLKALVCNASKVAAVEIESQMGLRDVDGANLPLVLIGFSKGCVVLNQILMELHLMDSDAEIKAFINLITDIYWLDGGHSGGSNTWITKHEVLMRLAALKTNVFVYVTPYQIEDDRRPWIRKEEKLFSDSLKKLKVNIERKVFFQNEPIDITIHFKLLEEF